MPHLGITLLLALLLSAIMAFTGEHTVWQRLCRAIYLFTTSVALVAAGGWVMFFLER